jgi:hypothetical protein
MGSADEIYATCHRPLYIGVGRCGKHRSGTARLFCLFQPPDADSHLPARRFLSQSEAFIFSTAGRLFIVAAGCYARFVEPIMLGFSHPCISMVCG